MMAAALTFVLSVLLVTSHAADENSSGDTELELAYPSSEPESLTTSSGQISPSGVTFKNTSLPTNKSKATTTVKIDDAKNKDDSKGTVSQTQPSDVTTTLENQHGRQTQPTPATVNQKLTEPSIRPINTNAEAVATVLPPYTVEDKEIETPLNPNEMTEVRSTISKIPLSNENNNKASDSGEIENTNRRANKNTVSSEEVFEIRSPTKPTDESKLTTINNTKISSVQHRELSKYNHTEKTRRGIRQAGSINASNEELQGRESNLTINNSNNSTTTKPESQTTNNTLIRPIGSITIVPTNLSIIESTTKLANGPASSTKYRKTFWSYLKKTVSVVIGIVGVISICFYIINSVT